MQGCVVQPYTAKERIILFFEVKNMLKSVQN